MSSEPLIEDLADWKRGICIIASRKMMNCSTWGNTLLANCLPASFCILDDVKKRFPEAFVVIGDIYKGDKNRIDPNALHNFKDGVCKNKPSFHAWIDLGSGDIFDVVGPSWLDLNYQYFDAETAAKEEVNYYSILTSEIDVSAFYSKLLKAQLKT